MSMVRLSSTTAPFDTPSVRSAAARLVLIADGLGLLPEDRPIERIDDELIREIARSSLSEGVAPRRSPGHPGRHGGVHLGGSLGCPHRATPGRASPRSPMPRRELTGLLRTYGHESLGRLLGELACQPASLCDRHPRRARHGRGDRIHFVSLLTTDLAGSYNAFGMRRWWERPRAALEGRSPREALGDDVGSRTSLRRWPSLTWRAPWQAPARRRDRLPPRGRADAVPVGDRRAAWARWHAAGRGPSPTSRRRLTAPGRSSCATRRSATRSTSRVSVVPSGPSSCQCRRRPHRPCPWRPSRATGRAGPICQAEARRLRSRGAEGLLAPSAALLDGTPSGFLTAGGLRPAASRRERTLVLFGPRPDLVGWCACTAGRPRSDLLPRVRPATLACQSSAGPHAHLRHRALPA